MNEIIEALIDWAKNETDVLALYLYGSQAHGFAGPLSDIDVAVLVSFDLPREKLWQWEKRWLAHWPEQIDLRLLNLAPLPFRYEVTAHGQRIWAADTGAVASIESLIWREYWDFKPVLEQTWQGYVARVMEQKSEAERRQYEAALAKIRTVHQRIKEAAGDHSGNVSKRMINKQPEVPEMT